MIAMEYDLARLFEHPFMFNLHLAPLIVTLGGELRGECLLNVEWRTAAQSESRSGTLKLTWDVSVLSQKYSTLQDHITNILERDGDQGKRIEMAAEAVAVAVMAHIEPITRFTHKAPTNTYHDYYLNGDNFLNEEAGDEMIEIAGRWENGLPGLFEEKKQQSNRNPTLKKRWVSVTIFSKTRRNRTEGLHP